MILRTKEPFWLLNSGLMHSYPALEENIETEILVIGGGVTGALVSHALMQAGHKVTLTEKRDIGYGSTSATTSMLQYEVDIQLQDLIEIIGHNGAVECYKRGITAIEDLARIVERNNINCNFEFKNSLYGADSRGRAKRVREEFEIRKKVRLPVEWFDAGEIRAKYGLNTYGGILSAKAASVDAYRLTHGLIDMNSEKGMSVYDKTEIVRHEYTGHRVLSYTQENRKILSEKVIYCSGYETLDLFKKKYARIISTYACISEKGIDLPSEMDNIIYWNTDSPYIYLRKADNDRLLVGGEDASYYHLLKPGEAERRGKKLVAKLFKNAPEINFRPDFYWGGAFGVTKDGLPLIGTHGDFPQTIFVMGLGGNGITFSVQAMDLVRKILSGENDPLLEFYRIDR